MCADKQVERIFLSVALAHCRMVSISEAVRLASYERCFFQPEKNLAMSSTLSGRGTPLANAHVTIAGYNQRTKVVRVRRGLSVVHTPQQILALCKLRQTAQAASHLWRS